MIKLGQTEEDEIFWILGKLADPKYIGILPHYLYVTIVSLLAKLTERQEL